MTHAGPNAIINLTWLDLVLAFALVLVAIALSAWQRLGLVRGFLSGAARAVVQLVAVVFEVQAVGDITTEDQMLRLESILDSGQGYRPDL